MAHYACLDKDNIVVDVIVGEDEETENGIGWEQHYQQIIGLNCKRTSYNTRAGVHINNGTAFRKNYAGIGYSYNQELDAFIPPKPYPSWLLDEATCLWHPPIPMPQDDKHYIWDETVINWVEMLNT
jgi:hypothetical protein